ncbi:MAG: 1-hydroxy-2-methyl-2-(E)-butenyl 4-diphosphate synthase, partial [Chitinophagaceae bacterium]
FTPNAAEIAAGIVEKVRVNPGNYVDKKKFEQIEYSDAEYLEEIDRIRERFTPLVLLCKKHGTAMRIGTNHGSLSDRIMSRYGDTAKGMVESAMEFLRIARSLNYHNIVLSMKSSNPLVMVQAYRLLVHQMMEEFNECYPLHLGVTEAGDGEDGRIKSAIGIGSLLEDGIGDTIRVSLTEDPEFEIPVCKDIVKRYEDMPADTVSSGNVRLAYSPFEYRRRESNEVKNIGARNVPVVVADFMQAGEILPDHLVNIGYRYDAITDKWSIGDAAADLIYSGDKTVSFELPGTLRIVCDHKRWAEERKFGHYPLFQGKEFFSATGRSPEVNFVAVEAEEISGDFIAAVNGDYTIVLCIYSNARNGLQRIRLAVNRLMQASVHVPVIIAVESHSKTIDEQLIDFSVQAGGLFLDGMGDGIWLMNDPGKMESKMVTGRTYLQASNNHAFLNNTSFSILQAVRTRISRTEYISCPSCGRTLFDLQETTTRIRSVT